MFIILAVVAVGISVYLVYSFVNSKKDPNDSK